MKTKKGFFVKCEYDLYPNIFLYGVFTKKLSAKKFAIICRNKICSPFWNEVTIIESNYIEVDNKIYPLCQDTMAIKPIMGLRYYR